MNKNINNTNKYKQICKNTQKSRNMSKNKKYKNIENI